MIESSLSGEEIVTDVEIRASLKALDCRDDVDLSSWESEFIDNLLYVRELDGNVDPNRKTLSEKQRGKALEILEKHEPQTSEGGQETITHAPPEVRKYLKKERPWQ